MGTIHLFNSLLIAILFCSAAPAVAQQQEVKVELDTSQVADNPGLVKWGEDAKAMIEEWHPRLSNLLASKGFTPPNEVRLVIRKSDKGIAHASGRTITVMSNWIEKRPGDVGLVIHELTHVIQRYRRTPMWVTEGIADYVRWAIYEGKPQGWFRCPKSDDGYKQGYRVTAGFLLWLEAGPAPGIVNRLNRAARKAEYDDAIFEEASGRSLTALWSQYVEERHR